MKQLSKDYLLVLLCTLSGSVLAYAIIHLPKWMDTLYFWQITCYTLVASIGFLLVNMYLNAGKLSTLYNNHNREN